MSRIFRNPSGEFARQSDVEIIGRYGEARWAKVKALEGKFEFKPVASSFITGLSYGELNPGVLLVEIGVHAYSYENVPLSVWEGFWYARSKGTFYNERIRGKYSGEKIR